MAAGFTSALAVPLGISAPVPPPAPPSIGVRSMLAFWMGGACAPRTVATTTGKTKLQNPTFKHLFNVPSNLTEAPAIRKPDLLAAQIQREDDEVSKLIVSMINKGLLH